MQTSARVQDASRGERGTQPRRQPLTPLMRLACRAANVQDPTGTTCGDDGKTTGAGGKHHHSGAAAASAKQPSALYLNADPAARLAEARRAVATVPVPTADHDDLPATDHHHQRQPHKRSSFAGGGEETSADVLYAQHVSVSQRNSRRASVVGSPRDEGGAAARHRRSRDDDDAAAKGAGDTAEEEPPELFARRVAELETRFREQMDVHRELNAALGETMHIEEQLALEQQARRQHLHAEALTFGTASVSRVSALDHRMAVAHGPPARVTSVPVDQAHVAHHHHHHHHPAQQQQPPLHPSSSTTRPAAMTAALVTSPDAMHADVNLNSSVGVQLLERHGGGAAAASGASGGGGGAAQPVAGNVAGTQTTAGAVPATPEQQRKPVVEVVRPPSPVVPYPRVVKTQRPPAASSPPRGPHDEMLTPQRRARFVDESPNPFMGSQPGSATSYQRRQPSASLADTGSTRAPSGSQPQQQQPPLFPSALRQSSVASVVDEVPSVRASLRGFGMASGDSVINDETAGDASMSRAPSVRSSVGERSIRVVYGSRYERPEDIPPTSSSSYSSDAATITSESELTFRSSSMVRSASVASRPGRHGSGVWVDSAKVNQLLQRFDKLCNAAESRLDAAVATAAAGGAAADTQPRAPAASTLRVTSKSNRGAAQREQLLSFLRQAKQRMITLEKQRVASAERRAAALLQAKKRRIQAAMQRVKKVGLQRAIEDGGIMEDFADDFEGAGAAAQRMIDDAGSIGDDVPMDFDDLVEDDMIDDDAGDIDEVIDDADFDYDDLMPDGLEEEELIEEDGLDDGIDYDLDIEEEDGLGAVDVAIVRHVPAASGDGSDHDDSHSHGRSDTYDDFHAAAHGHDDRIVSRRVLRRATSKSGLGASDRSHSRRKASAALDPSLLRASAADDDIADLADENDEDDDFAIGSPTSPRGRVFAGGIVARRTVRSPSAGRAKSASPPPRAQPAGATDARSLITRSDIESESMIYTTSTSSRLTRSSSAERRRRRRAMSDGTPDIDDEVRTIATTTASTLRQRRNRERAGEGSSATHSVAEDSDVARAARDRGSDADSRTTAYDSSDLADASDLESIEPRSSASTRGSGSSEASTATNTSLLLSEDEKERRRALRRHRDAELDRLDRINEEKLRRKRRKWLTAPGEVPTFSQLVGDEPLSGSFVGSSLTSDPSELREAAAAGPRATDSRTVARATAAAATAELLKHARGEVFDASPPSPAERATDEPAAEEAMPPIVTSHVRRGSAVEPTPPGTPRRRGSTSRHSPAPSHDDGGGATPRQQQQQLQRPEQQATTAALDRADTGTTGVSSSDSADTTSGGTALVSSSADSDDGFSPPLAPPTTKPSRGGAPQEEADGATAALAVEPISMFPHGGLDKLLEAQQAAAQASGGSARGESVDRYTTPPAEEQQQSEAPKPAPGDGVAVVEACKKSQSPESEPEVVLSPLHPQDDDGTFALAAQQQQQALAEDPDISAVVPIPAAYAMMTQASTAATASSSRGGKKKVLHHIEEGGEVEEELPPPSSSAPPPAVVVAQEQDAVGPSRVSYVDDLVALERWRNEQLELLRGARGGGATASASHHHVDPAVAPRDRDGKDDDVDIDSPADDVAIGAPTAAGGVNHGARESEVHLATLEVLLDTFAGRRTTHHRRQPGDDTEDEEEEETDSYSNTGSSLETSSTASSTLLADGGSYHPGATDATR